MLLSVFIILLFTIICTKKLEDLIVIFPLIDRQTIYMHCWMEWMYWHWVLLRISGSQLPVNKLLFKFNSLFELELFEFLLVVHKNSPFSSSAYIKSSDFLTWVPLQHVCSCLTFCWDNLLQESRVSSISLSRWNGIWCTTDVRFNLLDLHSPPSRGVSHHEQVPINRLGLAASSASR